MTNLQFEEQPKQPSPRRPGGIHHHWLLYLIEGTVLVALGALAVFMPIWLGIALFGWLFLIGGAVGLFTTFLIRQAPGFWWSLLSAVITIGAGITLFAEPMLGMVTLFLLLMTFLVFEGIFTILFALEHRRELSERWAWMLASGIIDLCLAGIILLGLPTTSTWAIGLIVGINLATGGAAMIGMALVARARATKPASAEPQYRP